jgi:hypothetical protein
VTETRARERERKADQWFGAPREGQVPVRAAAGGSATPGGADEARPVARWLRRIGRVLRDAVIAVAILAMVPIGLVSVSKGSVWQNSGFSNTRLKLSQGELSRPFAPSRDAAITPMQAGLALAALQPASSRPSPSVFPERPISARAVRPWDGVPLSADMFTTARPVSWGGPNNLSILEAAAKGLSAKELAYLKTVATAPLWAQYDLIARAPAVDIIGGRFQLPFPRDAWVAEMPIMRFAGTKELAYAGVSRAAYYLAVGQRAEAEEALKSVIGFGFAIIDNGTFAIDGIIGRVLVGIGRDALERFYTLTGDSRAAAVVAARPPEVGNGPTMPRSNTPTAAFIRERLLNFAGNPAEPRTLRYEALNQLSLASCTNVRELVFGTGSDVKQAFDLASRDLARFPSERSLLDVALRTTELPSTAITRLGIPTGGVVARLLVDASTVAGSVLDNPRMPFCARVITGSFRP